MASVKYPVPFLHGVDRSALFVSNFEEGGAVWRLIRSNNQFFANKTTQAVFTYIYAAFGFLFKIIRCQGEGRDFAEQNTIRP